MQASTEGGRGEKKKSRRFRFEYRDKDIRIVSRDATPLSSGWVMALPQWRLSHDIQGTVGFVPIRIASCFPAVLTKNAPRTFACMRMRARSAPAASSFAAPYTATPTLPAPMMVFSIEPVISTPALARALANSSRYCIGSGSAWAIISKRKCIPAHNDLSNAACAGETWREIPWLSRNVSARASSKAKLSSTVRSVALAAFSVALMAAAFASEARISAAATFSSDLRFNSFWRSPAICPNLISKATPIATTLLARDEPHCSQKESYGGCSAAMATSAITPTTTKPPPNHSHRSHDSMDSSSLESLALVMPFGRRHAGKGFKGFCGGVGVGALMFIALFAIYLPQ
jgi:hypothetical protein